MPPYATPVHRLIPIPGGYGTGLEWMPLASVLAALVLLLLIAWYGSRNTV